MTTSSSNSSVADQLAKLAALHAVGAISDNELDKIKTELIATLCAPTVDVASKNIPRHNDHGSGDLDNAIHEYLNRHQAKVSAPIAADATIPSINTPAKSQLPVLVGYSMLGIVPALLLIGLVFSQSDQSSNPGAIVSELPTEKEKAGSVFSQLAQSSRSASNWPASTVVSAAASPPSVTLTLSPGLIDGKILDCLNQLIHS